MAQVENLLVQALTPAFEAVAGERVDPVVRRSTHSDFQADGALALARKLGKAPRVIASEIVDQADLSELCSSVAVSGPGFINLTVRDEVLADLLAQVGSDERLAVAPADQPETVVIDYSAPNLAKEMHVGHVRSTIIGDAAVRLLEWLGHTVIRQNHVGDWGTPFGMLIEHMLDLGESEAANDLSIGDLNNFYRAARGKFDTDPDFADRSRRRVVALQSGDSTTRQLWQTLVNESEKYFLSVYDKLDVRLTEDDFAGESSYNDQLESVVTELDDLGLLSKSDGALCVFPQGFTNRDGEPLPLIVKKRDGGFGYASTDLATIRHRIRNLKGTRLLYVVGTPQQQHFAMIYQTAREAGWLTDPVRAEHIGFGSILGPDGKMLRTRAGTSIKLADLVQEAIDRADAVIADKNPELPAHTKAEVARAVGIGAVKYADLSTDRIKDYVFDYDRMLAFDGNTAPYLQYAHARICSIFRRAGLEPARDGKPVTVTESAERALALELLAFEPTILHIAQTLEFHRLATYLFTLATTFTTFYEQCPVLRAESDTKTSRLALCDLTARTLATGLGLLGITAPQQM